MRGFQCRAGVVAAVAGLLATLAVEVRAGELRAGAAKAVLEATDGIVIGGGIGPGWVKGQEGELRASAVVIEGPSGGKACLVACDVLMVERDVLDVAARRISEKLGIRFDAVLINVTHTHHAPTTSSLGLGSGHRQRLIRGDERRRDSE